jgi:DNA-binding LytR/AlgR family response regulator
MSWRIPVRNKSRIVLLDPQAIDLVEACGNYARLYQGDSAHLMRGTLSGFEQRLAKAGFVRIHRSAMVNISFVVSLEPSVSGDYRLHLSTGRVVTLSRTYREQFFSFIDAA